MSWKLINGNNIDILKEYEDNTFDSIVTDPPYGIEFLGKDWDSNTGAVETWKECFRVLKPGGHILAFSAARTYHNLATNIESVGFDIRDQLMWLYGSGFPKAQDIGKAIDKRANKGKEQTIKAEYNDGKHGTKNVDIGVNGVRCPVCKKDSNERYKCGKGQECGMIYKSQTPEGQQWAGWKTALKPAHEPIVMARKPFKGPCVDNVLNHGTGALNIDESRVEWGPGEQEKEQKWREKYMKKNVGGPTFQGTDIHGQTKGGTVSDAPPGRFPSNVLGEVEDYQKYFYNPNADKHEPIVMARKPFKGPCVDNVLKHGTGALNIDESRVPFEEGGAYWKTWKKNSLQTGGPRFEGDKKSIDYKKSENETYGYSEQGRFPSNVLGEVEDYQKYFYCPKVSRAERHAGFEQLPIKNKTGDSGLDGDFFSNNVTWGKSAVPDKKGNLDHIPKTKGGMLEQTIISSENKHCPGQMYSIGKNMKPTVQAKGNLDHIPKNNGGMLDSNNIMYIRATDKGVGNNHPTVKPIALMKYLVKLVTPPGGTVLDPFNGSGSTGMACVELGFDYIGCELDPDYIDIATRRIGAWESKFKGPKYDLFE